MAMTRKHDGTNAHDQNGMRGYCLFAATSAYTNDLPFLLQNDLLLAG